MSQKPCPNCGVLNAPDARACADCWTEFPANATGAAAAPPASTAPAIGSPTPTDSAPGYASGRPGVPPAAPVPTPPPVAPPAAPGGFPPPPPPPAPSAPLAPSAPGGGRPGQPQFPAQGWTPPETKSSRNKIVPIVGIVIGIAIVRAISSGVFSSASVTLPPTLGGEPQITTGPAATQATEIEGDMAKSGVRGGDGAAYGTGGEASFFVFVAPGDDESAQSLYDAFSSGIVSAGGSMGTSSTEPAGEISLVCSQMLNGSSPVGSVCTWSQGNQGVIFTDNSDVKATAAAGAEINAAA